MPANKHSTIEELEKKLLGFGGDSFPRPEGFSDPHLDLLMSGGQIWKPWRVRRVEGVPHRCHGNAVVHYLWDRHFGCRSRDIVTGYALSKGLWHQHSWLWDGRHIWESTSRRDLYFGVVLQGEDITRFVFVELINNGLVPAPSNVSEEAS